MNDETRAVLNRAFPAELIKTRQGPGGTRLRYVEGAEYIRRLNEAFAGDWSFDVIDSKRDGKEIVVLGRLTIGGIVKTSYGGQEVKVSRQSGEPVCLADDYKAAATDALKKAASLLGVGLHLYHGDGEATGDDAGASAPPPPADESRGETRRAPSTPGSSGGAPRSNGGGQGGHGNTATDKQISAIHAIAKTLGMTPDKVREWSMRTYGCGVSELSRANASALIGEMQNRATKEAGR